MDECGECQPWHERRVLDGEGRAQPHRRAGVGATGRGRGGPLFRRSETPLLDAATTLFGVAYTALLLGFAIDLRNASVPGMDASAGFAMVAAVMMCIWGADSLAYFVGRSGRHPLMPRVSPKKTWEGTLGGIAGALVVAVVLKLTVLAFLPWPHLLAMVFFCGVVSQLGDLAESRMKRIVGVKDSGTILPGHGGLLDRFDATILAAPCVYLYLVYVAGIIR